MIDLRAARNDPEAFRAALRRRGADNAFDELLAADGRWRALVPQVDELRARQKIDGKPTPEQIEELKGVKDRLRALEARLKAHFDGRLFISKSLPYFLELASPDATKGTGLAFLAGRLGFAREGTVAFGDGENDVELLEWAGYGVAVENAHDRVRLLRTSSVRASTRRAWRRFWRRT